MAEEINIQQTFIETFGISKLKGISIGNFLILTIICILIAGLIGFLVWRWYSKKYIFINQISVFGMIGNKAGFLYEDRAKEVRFGHIGDTLFFLKKKKRYIPPAILQIAPKKFWFWRRSDGELINIGLEDLDEKMKRLGCFFIHSDMRMQRLGIEKNLQFRLQEQTFWQKYGGLIVNIAIFVIVTILMIVLFMEWRKTGVILSQIADKVGSYLETAQNVGQRPVSSDSGGSGVIPAFAVLLLKFLRREK
ncbi:MAG TPA: hypothetical protein VGB37_14335 [Candidatus Lokiarchaeia archaeon]